MLEFMHVPGGERVLVKANECAVQQCENHLLLRAGLVVQLAAGLPEGHLLDSVDTIWQCTVPSSSIRHMGPNTSLALAPGTSKYSTTAATEGSKTFGNSKQNGLFREPL